MEKLHPPDKLNVSFKNGYNLDPSSITLTSVSQTDISVSDDHHRNKSDVENQNNVGNQEDNSSAIYHETDDVEQVSQEIDRFTHAPSEVDNKSNPPEVPDTVETFSKIIESRIAKYNSAGAHHVFMKMTEEDSFFIEAVMCIYKTTNLTGEFSSTPATSVPHNRTSIVLQHAMTFMEDELRSLLEYSSTNQSIKENQEENDSDRCILHAERETESTSEEEYPGYPPEVVTKMSRYVSTMISTGYETECCQVYSLSRINALNKQLEKLEYEKMNMDDIWRMNWDSLEGEIKRWINVIKNCSNTLFPGEKRLCDSVFANNPSISRNIFSHLARTVVIQLLDFAEATSMTKRSAEKLFKFLDMYEALNDLIPSIAESCSDDFEPIIKSEIRSTADRIGDAAFAIFSDLENSIKNDVAKAPVAGGAVHPLTRYVMNYLKYACEYKESLEQIFAQRAPRSDANADEESRNDVTHDSETEGTTGPFSKQLVTVMDLLDTNLEAKSKLYRDPSLCYIFLMNNGRYILQKVKGSPEIGQVMGENWCRRRSTIVRQFHKNYQRETWVRLLHTLSHEGLLVQGKINKPMLKERFKNFNNMFEEIHRTQSTWVVHDEQLQSELRVSISAVVIPAYRSFLGRFRQYLDSSKQVEKYIKYQPEDIETLIEDFFAGNNTSMAKRRT